MRKRHLFFSLLFLYFLFKPIYLFNSGMPQLADYCIIILLLALLITKKKYIVNESTLTKVNNKFKCVYPFFLWVVAINVLWSIELYNFELIKPIIFYLFNIIAIYVVKELFFLFGEELFFRISNYICISCSIQSLLVLFSYTAGIRSTGLFNNPNQLGFYALVCFTYLLHYKKFCKHNMLYIISIISSMYLILASLSKAAILGALFLVLLLLIFKYRKKMIIILLISFFVFSTDVGSFIYSNVSRIGIINQAVNKINNIQNENDSDLSSGRGYARLDEIGMKIIYGVGEGANYRFISLNGNEIHSAYASIICCYGIIGMIMLIFLIIRFINFNYKNYIELSGIFVFGVTHQMWRNTLLWILLIMICVMEEKTPMLDEKIKNS